MTTDVRRPPARRADAARNRERIIDGARAVLARRGLSAEIMEIAAEAGVGAGTLYRNLGSRKEVIAAIVREMGASFEGAVAEASGQTSAARSLELIIRSGFELLDRYGRLVLDLLGGGAGQAYDSEFNRERVRAALRFVFQEAVRRGELPPGFDTEFALGMLQGLFAPRALEFMLATHTPTDVADLAVAFYLRGIGLSPDGKAGGQRG